jgi:hypothetical protein
MTIPIELRNTAALIAANARSMEGRKNPFITLESLEALCKDDETLMECLTDMVRLCLRYTETVCRFKEVVLRGQQSNEDDSRKQIEVVKTSCHDATISSVNILSRALHKAGKDNTWVKDMALQGRAMYAKFALLIAFESIHQKGAL